MRLSGCLHLVSLLNMVKRVERAGERLRLGFRAQPDREFDFVIWSGLARDFARAQRRVVRRRADREVLASSLPQAAAGSVANVRGGRGRRFPSEFYPPALLRAGLAFGNDVGGSTDSHAEANVSSSRDADSGRDHCVIPQGIGHEDYALRNYTIDGGDPDVRTLSVASYGDWAGDGAEQPPRDEVVGKVVEFFTEGFGADRVEVLATRSFE